MRAEAPAKLLLVASLSLNCAGNQGTLPQRPLASTDAGTDARVPAPVERPSDPGPPTRTPLAESSLPTGRVVPAVVCEGTSVRCEQARRLVAEADSALGPGSLAFGEGGAAARDAEGRLKQAHELVDPSDFLRLQLARAQLALGQTEAPLAVLSELAGTYRADAEVQGAYGVALLAGGRIQAANTAFSRAVELEPGQAERRVALGTTQFLLGMLSQAEESFRAALRLRPDAKAHGDLGALLVVDGRAEEGAQQLRVACQMAPERATYRTNLAYALLVLGDLPAATREASRALELDPTLVSAWLNHGLVLIERGELDLAESAFREAQRLAPSDPRPLSNLEDLDRMRVRSSPESERRE